jgi:hypothetical protein
MSLSEYAFASACADHRYCSSHGAAAQKQWVKQQRQKQRKRYSSAANDDYSSDDSASTTTTTNSSTTASSNSAADSTSDGSRLYLKLDTHTPRLKSGSYCKGDLWAVSIGGLFQVTYYSVYPAYSYMHCFNTASLHASLRAPPLNSSNYCHYLYTVVLTRLPTFAAAAATVTFGTIVYTYNRKAVFTLYAVCGTTSLVMACWQLKEWGVLEVLEQEPHYHPAKAGESTVMVYSAAMHR